MLQANSREADANMDLDKVAGVGGIQTQYPTALPFHSKNKLVAQRFSGNLIEDAFAAASARRIRLLARMDISKVCREVAEHLEWCYVSPAGELQRHTGGLALVCPSPWYYQEWIFDIMDEVVRRYLFDGFFIDWTATNEEYYYNFIAQKLLLACLSLRKAVDILFYAVNNANLLQCISRSGYPLTYMMGIPGWILYLCLDSASEIHSYMIEKQYHDALYEYCGLYLAILRRYQVVLLPNLGLPKSDVVVVLDVWVLNGGHSLNSLPASSRLALNDKREQLCAHNHIYTGPLVACSCILSPPEKVYSNIQVEKRGYGIGSFDRGKGVVIPFAVGAGYRKLGLLVYRDFFIRVLTEEDVRRETFHAASQSRWKLLLTGQDQMLSISSTCQVPQGRALALIGGTIRVRGEKAKTHALQSGRELETFKVIVIEGL
ncbi:hypothetical protein BJY00DRAFT_303612 [Aspergillus carlsbadensis]|nr:hypothetical protein BJY00DRAFT_303612 [Aspergillus carlsbadensis]